MNTKFSLPTRKCKLLKRALIKWHVAAIHEKRKRNKPARQLGNFGQEKSFAGNAKGGITYSISHSAISLPVAINLSCVISW